MMAGPYRVMRLAPMIGRPDAPRRISVAAGASRLEWALATAHEENARAQRFPHRREAYWIERQGQPARRPTR